MTHAAAVSCLGTLALLLPTCLPAASIVTVDTYPSGSHRAAVAFDVLGNPMIAYRGLYDFRLRLARCLDPDCDDAAINEVRDQQGNALLGDYPSVALAGNGRPVLSAYNYQMERLVIASCAEPDCSTGAGTVIPNEDDVGVAASMRLDSRGRPRIAFYDPKAQLLRIVICETASCSTVVVRTLVSNVAASVHNLTSLAMDADDHPVVAFVDQAQGSVNLVRCISPDCVGRSSLAVVDAPPGGDYGHNVALTLAAGDRPVLSYYDAQNQSLKLARCQQRGCNGAIQIRTIDDRPAGAGFFSAIAVRADDRPLIAYLRGIGDAAGGGVGLNIAECSSPDCDAAALIPVDISPTDFRGGGVDMALDQAGAAAIAYHDNTLATLKLARCAPHTCRGPADQLFLGDFEVTSEVDVSIPR